MRSSKLSRKALRGVRLALVATSLLAATPAFAQLTTATIRGQVSNSTAMAPGATVTAVSVDTGATARAVAGPDGSYVLTGLSPGAYDITFAVSGGPTVTRRVSIQVGQTATLDMDVAAPDKGTEEATSAATATTGAGGSIVVTGRRLVETRTSENATNVTSNQIENLPQSNRNFLNFAQLAPGIRIVQAGELRQTFAGGGVGADPNGDSFGGPQVNVFIDGVSLKSNINQGGVVGQDVSAGNPFSQLAVREFRVLTSNFKAEFEDAGTSIITAVTKSGTNQFHGEVFGLWQNQSLIAKDFFQKRDNQHQGKLKRWQYGVAFGGPIIEDKLFFFGNYEANIKDRTFNVVPGVPLDDQAALLNFDVNDFRGSFTGPFREHLGFGKFTLQAADNHLIELSGSIRKEKDLRDFGGQNSRDRGVHVKNDVYTARLTDRFTGEGFLNEASVDFLKSDLAFGAPDTTSFGQIFQGVIAIGGRADFQTIKQQGLTFRDDLSLTNIEWNGRHLVKIGGKLSFQKYQVGGSGPFANPQFEFVFQPSPDPAQNLDFSTPANVRFGGGNPNVKAKTTQIGLFVQDDWEVNDHLLINAGLRWDVDTNAKNNHFVTSPEAAAALRALAADPRSQPSFFDVEDFISTGHNRKIDYNNFAPRIGFSYDINADQRTVFYGGYGRYYDRTLFRSAAEETLLRQFRQGELLFSAPGAPGAPRNGRPTIPFDPSFLTPEGFAALLASLATNPLAPGTTELRVIPNDLKTPYTDQFIIGVRQRFGIFRTVLSFNHTIGKDQIGYAPLNKGPQLQPDGFFTFIPLINGFGTAVAAFNSRATKYDAVFLTVDKPYTRASGWGGGIAYTAVLRSKERGFSFNFDLPNIAEQPFVPNAGNEKHRLVINGIADLPLDFRISGLITYGSGAPFFVIDANRAPAPAGFTPEFIRLGFFNHLPHFLQVDLRLQKLFKLGEDREFGISFEVFNLFNRANFGGADGFTCCGGNPNFGKPNSLSGPPRSFQLGANVRW